MGNKWFFGLKFVYFSIMSLLLWYTVSDRYHSFLAYIAHFPLEVICGDVYVVETTTVEDIFYRYSGRAWQFPVGNVTANLIPFLSLVLSTPKIRILKRLRAVGIGLGVLFLFHVLSVISIPLLMLIRSHIGYAELLFGVEMFLKVVVIGLIPVLLWICLILTGMSEIVRRMIRRE